jgi:hypothetical protein
MTNEDKKIIAEGLGLFFANNPEKVAYWLMAENLNFGGASPCQLIALGRGHKVAQFVKNAIEENQPPVPPKVD